MGEQDPVTPAAVVLVASDRVDEQLQQVMGAQWSGPVVLVGSVEEARELVGAGRVAPLEDLPDTRSAAPGDGTDMARRQLVLDPDLQAVRCAGEEKHLTPLEFAFLRALLTRPGRVRAFPDLTDEVWGTRHLRDVSQVHSLVKRLRRKLDGIDSPVQVQAVRGVGFRAVVRPPAP